MNKKKIIGLVLLVIGIGLLIYGIYGASEMSKARGDIDEATSYIPKNRAKGYVSRGLHGEVDKYRTPVTILFVAGAVFTIAGVVVMVKTRKKRS